MRILTISLLFLCACGGKGETGAPRAGTPTGGSTLSNPFADHPIVTAGFSNVAHRGGGALAPEETMAAYQNAVDVGADTLEMDVWMTSDGVLYLMHDDTVDRTTDGTGAGKTMTWDELQQLDAAYKYTTDDGATFPLRGTGVTVPRFEDVLAAFPDKTFSIEIKQQDPPIVDELIAALDATGAAERAVVSSFYDAQTQKVRDKRPDIFTGMGTTEGLSFFYAEEAEYEPTAFYLAAPTELGDIVLDEPTIEKAHRFGITVHVWTVNDPTEMQQLIDWGADGIITDDPETLAGLAP